MFMIVSNRRIEACWSAEVVSASPQNLSGVTAHCSVSITKHRPHREQRSSSITAVYPSQAEHLHPSLKTAIEINHYTNAITQSTMASAAKRALSSVAVNSTASLTSRPPLIHLHLPGITPYATAQSLQESIVSRFLASKPPSSLAQPPPHIITAEFRPVYTCGRREVGKLSQEQISHLRADGKADFVEAMRGGQTTFHGPGQLVAYPIINLPTHKLSPRSYVCLLEKSLIATCAAFGVRAFTTENTGVWTSEDEKVAAIGVHMRRNVTSHGVGLNVSTDLWWFDRIVACGLEGKRTTSLMRELESKGKEEILRAGNGRSVDKVREAFVERFVERLEVVEDILQVDAGEYLKHPEKNLEDEEKYIENQSGR